MPLKSWFDKLLRLFRTLAQLQAGIIALLTVYHAVKRANEFNFIGIHLTQNQVVRTELWFQVVAIVLLSGFVFELPPPRRDEEWVKSEEPGVKTVFGELSVDGRKRRLQNTVKSMLQFRIFWILIWLAWSGLYIAWLVSPPPLTKAVTTPTVLGDIFNMLSAAAFFLCYSVMARRTTPWRESYFPVFAFFILIVLGVIGSAGFLWIGQQPSSLESSHWIQGLIAAVALALLVGRLESGLLRSNGLLVGALYTYAAIQVTYSRFPDKVWVFLVATSLALVLKVALFHEFRRLISDGTLYWYLFEYRKLIDSNPDTKVEIVPKNLFLSQFLETPRP